MANGGRATASQIVVGARGEIHGNGNLVGAVQNGGLVSPGASAGALQGVGCRRFARSLNRRCFNCSGCKVEADITRE